MIEIKNLTKQYGKLTAVDQLSCTIEAGKIYGLLGANGAGKTTTMNMITGALAPTAGSITVCGNDLISTPLEAKRHIGYLPELPPLYPELTVREYLSFVAQAKGSLRTKIEGSVNSVIAQTQLTAVSDRLIRNLSKGYCQRVGIAQAVLGEPDILILDEPTVGLDPRQIVEIRKLIRSLANKRTVILSSHILPEVAELCDTILILSSGKLVAMDSLVNLQKAYLGPDLLHLRVRCAPKKCEEILKGLSGARKIRASEVSGLTEIIIECEKGIDLREAVFFAFAGLRCPILEMQLQEASLEDVFLRATTPMNTAEGNNRLSDKAFSKAPVGRGSKEKQSVTPFPSLRNRPPVSSRPDESALPPQDDDSDESYTPLFGRKENRK